LAALTRKHHQKAVEALAARDSDLRAIVQSHGPPPFRSRPTGFETLVHIILEQQVSLASAKATLDKLTLLLPGFTPAAYLKLPDEDLRGAGVSRQKMRYTRAVAGAIEDGSLPITTLARRSDDRVRELLTALPGIGNWTADCYMMLAMKRPDLWPVGDLALVKAIQVVKGLRERPDAAFLEELSEQYRPLRSVATQLYWHQYLSK